MVLVNFRLLPESVSEVHVVVHPDAATCISPVTVKTSPGIVIVRL